MTRAIYLHGFASGPSSKKARFFAERLTDCGVTLAVPDLAEGDFEHLTISNQLRVVERVASGSRVSLIGSSLGGYLAALYAARHPDQVERLVLMAPAFSFMTIFPQNVGAEKMMEWRSTGNLPVFHYAAGKMRHLAYQLIQDGRQYEDFPDFSQPTLIFHGIRDDAVRPQISKRFASTHPNVTLRLLDSNHELTNVLQPMCEEAIEFLGYSKGS